MITVIIIELVIIIATFFECLSVVMMIKSCELVAQLYPAVCDPMDCSPPGSSVWNSPGKNTGVGCHFLLQRIFLTQELNPGSPELQADSLLT